MADTARVPSWNLAGAIEVARAIDDHGGKASNAEVAALLGYSGVNNGAFLTRMSAAKQYGLVEGRGSDLRPTQRAIRILRPDFPATAEQAKIEAFMLIPVFQAFFEAYKDQTLPDRAGILNALQNRFRLPVAKAREAHNVMMASAETAGLFRVGGKTKLILPTSVPSAKPKKDEGVGVEPTPAPPNGEAEGDRLERKLGKLLVGVIEVLPSGDEWDEASLQDWLQLIEAAARLRYKLSRKEVDREKKD